MKCAVFPGQGNQYIGMGKDIYSLDIVKKMYDVASEVSGIDIKKISFEGPSELQRETLNTQLLTYVNSCALFELIPENFNVFAGHSIGEYAALFATGVFSFEDGVRIVKKRGELMSSLSFDEPSLVAVLGVDRKCVEDFCKNDTNNELEVALCNSPGNYVVGGLPENIKKYKLPGKVKPLAVSGPFHTSLFKPVAEEFQKYLQEFEFKDPQSVVYSNATGLPYYKGEIDKGLASQLYKPVLWQDIIEAIPADRFVEIGPGNSLAKMINKIRKDANVVSIQNV